MSINGNVIKLFPSIMKWLISYWILIMTSNLRYQVSNKTPNWITSLFPIEIALHVWLVLPDEQQMGLILTAQNFPFVLNKLYYFHIISQETVIEIELLFKDTPFIIFNYNIDIYQFRQISLIVYSVVFCLENSVEILSISRCWSGICDFLVNWYFNVTVTKKCRFFIFKYVFGIKFSSYYYGNTNFQERQVRVSIKSLKYFLLILYCGFVGVTPVFGPSGTLGLTHDWVTGSVCGRGDLWRLVLKGLRTWGTKSSKCQSLVTIIIYDTSLITLFSLTLAIYCPFGALGLSKLVHSY